MSREHCVGIVGAGPFGTALANLVASAGRPVTLFSLDPHVIAAIRERRENPRVPDLSLSPSVSATDDPGQFCRDARFLVIAVSSTEVRQRVHLLGDHLDGQHIVVHAIGALASPDDTRVSQVIEEETPVLRIGALAGPALWRDLMSGRFSSMVVASAFDEVTREARRLLSVPPALRLYSGHDLIGVEMAAALSCAYTVAVGISDGLGLGPGPRAVLITRALAEASRLGRAVGASDRTFTGLAGLGNLLVRTQSEHSADYLAGLELAEADTVGAPTEGTRAALAGVRLARRVGQRAPVLTAIARVVQGELTAREAASAAADTVADEE